MFESVLDYLTAFRDQWQIGAPGLAVLAAQLVRDWWTGVRMRERIGYYVWIGSLVVIVVQCLMWIELNNEIKLRDRTAIHARDVENCSALSNRLDEFYVAEGVSYTLTNELKHNERILNSYRDDFHTDVALMCETLDGYELSFHASNSPCDDDITATTTIRRIMSRLATSCGKLKGLDTATLMDLKLPRG